MNDLADEARQDLAVALAPEPEPMILNPEEKATEVPVCEYCGHSPCGCGG